MKNKLKILIILSLAANVLNCNSKLHKTHINHCIDLPYDVDFLKTRNSIPLRKLSKDQIYFHFNESDNNRPGLVAGGYNPLLGGDAGPREHYEYFNKNNSEYGCKRAGYPIIIIGKLPGKYFSSIDSFKVVELKYSENKFLITAVNNKSKNKIGFQEPQRSVYFTFGVPTDLDNGK